MLQVRLSEENIVTVEAGQHDPNGPELAIIDRAILGGPGYGHEDVGQGQEADQVTVAET